MAGKLLQWNPVAPNYSGSNQMMANATRSVASAADIAGDLTNSFLAREKAAADEAYKNELLGMQKAEHQMRVDDRTAKDAMALGLMKPKELSNAASLTDIIPAADIEKMAVLPTDTPAQVAEKEKLQGDLGRFSQTMASNPKYLETQAEYLQRVGSTMGGKVPLEMAVMMNTARDAETVAKAAALEKNEQAMRAAEKEHLQFGLDAIKTMRGTSSRSGSKDANGDGIVDSTELAATKQLLKLSENDATAAAKAMEVINKEFSDKKYADISGDKLAAAKSAVLENYNQTVAKGADPLVAAEASLLGVKKTHNSIMPDTVSVSGLTDTAIGETIDRSIKNRAAQRAQIGNLLGTTGTVADADIRDQVSKLSSLMDKSKARLEEEKKLIEMSPQERTQYSLLKDLQGKGMVEKPEVLKAQQENQQRAVALQQSPEELQFTQKYGVKPPRGYYDKVPDKWRTKIDVSEKQLTDIVNQMPADVRNHPLAKDIAIATAAESSGDGQLLGDGKTSAGLLQWRNERQVGALDWINRQQGTGKKYDKLADVPNEWQYRYALHDMTEGGYRDLGKMLSGVTSPAERARLISDHYEVPAYGYHEGKIRGEAAVKYDAVLDKLLKPAGSKTPEVTTADVPPVKGVLPPTPIGVTAPTQFKGTVVDVTPPKLDPNNKKDLRVLETNLEALFDKDPRSDLLPSIANALTFKGSTRSTVTDRTLLRASNEFKSLGLDTPEKLETFINTTDNGPAKELAQNYQFSLMTADPKYKEVLHDKQISDAKWSIAGNAASAVPLGKVGQVLGKTVMAPVQWVGNKIGKLLPETKVAEKVRRILPDTKIESSGPTINLGNQPLLSLGRKEAQEAAEELVKLRDMAPTTPEAAAQIGTRIVELERLLQLRK